MIIYKITNKINGKMYIGQTIRTLSHRKNGHYTNYKNNVHTKLYDAMRKYGWDNFEFEPICSCLNIDVLNKMETFFIKYYNTIENGYNMYEGGDNNSMFNSAIKEKHLKRMRSLETRQKISISMKKLRSKNGFSEETRKKISSKLMGNKHFLGHKRTLSAINKTRQSLFKSVYCINLDGKKIAEFESLIDADKWWFENGYNTTKNYKYLSNVIRKSFTKNIYIKGLKWFYK